jgi:phosphoglycerate dehydrogenase-like enzyme
MENCALINTSRGRIVNEPNIIKWLEKSEGHYYFADVLQDENGNIYNSKLLEKLHLSPQIIITPHIGGMTYQGQNIAYRDIAKLLVEELQKN